MPENKIVPDEEQKEDLISRRGFEQFIKAADRDNPVTVILRSHLLAEYYLDQLLIGNMARGDIFIKENFTFRNKIIVAEAMHILPGNYIESLKGLNSVRNDCSHVKDYAISERDIDKIGLSFGKKYLELKYKHKDLQDLLFHTLMFLIAGLCVNISMMIEKTKSK